MRAVELRKAGKMGPIFANGRSVSVGESVYDPYGTKRWYSYKQFQKLVEQLETT